jgi:hypothetical protein
MDPGQRSASPRGMDSFAVVFFGQDFQANVRWLTDSATAEP